MLSVNHQILSLVLCANVNSNNLIIHLFKELGIDYLGGPVLHLYMAYALALSLCIGAHLRGSLNFFCKNGNNVCQKYFPPALILLIFLSYFFLLKSN